MEKNRVLNHSVTHSTSLFDVPGTEAIASEKERQKERYHRQTRNTHWRE